jgi:hypothetical protein
LSAAAKKTIIRVEREFRDLLNPFFKHPVIENSVILLILFSLIAAAGSILFETPWINRAHWVFTVLFTVELSLRFFTYDRKHKKEYLQDWWIDWVATIPWDALLFFFVPGGNMAVVRLLRLPRVMRLLRFRKEQQSWLCKSLAYRFKRLLEGSIFRQMLVLAAGSLVVVAGFAWVLNKTGAEFESGDSFWFALISVISSDSLFELQAQPLMVKAVVFLLTVIGIVVFNGILIAIIVGKLMSHLTEIKKGYGEVRESGHILLLGDSEYIPHILDELQVYCRTERKRLMKVVVMKEMPDETVERNLFSFRPSVEVIRRVGRACNPNALERLSVLKARGVVVFGGCGGDRQDTVLNDALVNKTLLSIRHLQSQSGGENTCLRPLLTYLSEQSYPRECLLNGLQQDKANTTNNELRPVEFCPGEYTANLIACMCANPYAYEIYSELLTADGNEFHILKNFCVPGDEITFGQLLDRFPKAIPVGFRDEQKGVFRLVPDVRDKVPQKTDLLVLAQDSCSAKKTARGAANNQVTDALAATPAEEKQLVMIIGVNDKLPAMLRELDKLNRRILVADNQSDPEFRTWIADRGCNTVEFKECYFQSGEEIEGVLGSDLKAAAQIIVLADGHLLEDAAPDQIDAETLTRLLSINGALPAENPPHLIVEILTRDSEQVVKEIHANCFHVVGPLFIGRMLTTFTLYPDLAPVFKTLIESGDVDIRVTPLAEEWRDKTFADLLRSPPSNAIPIGIIRNDAHDFSPVCLNPPKEQPLSRAEKVIYLVRSELNKKDG